MKTQQVPSPKKRKLIVHDTHYTGREKPMELKLEWGESGKESQERGQLVQG